MHAMNPTLTELTAQMQRNGGSLNLSGTGITSLPDGLSVGGALNLSGTGITSLPDGLSVGGWLYLRGDGVNYPVTMRNGSIKIGCEDHPIAFWRALDDKGCARMDRKNAVKWWRVWGAELLRWHDARVLAGSAVSA